MSLTTGENNQVVTTTIKHSSCTAWQYAVCLQYFSDNSMYLSNITVHRVYTCYPNKTELCYPNRIESYFSTTTVPSVKHGTLLRLHSNTGLRQGPHIGCTVSVFILDFGYSDMRRTGPCCSAFQYALLSDTDSWSSECSWEYTSR